LPDILLARYARTIFWLARYVERAENLARILETNATFARDRQGAQHWHSLLELHSERQDGGPAKRFAIRNGNQVAFVQSSEIDWIEAVGDYAGLHVAKKMHLLREPLHLLECRLDRTEFLRIHRSTIVKLDRITRIEPLANRDCRVTLQDGTHLRVSRTYSKPLHDLLRNRESAPISL